MRVPCTRNDISHGDVLTFGSVVYCVDAAGHWRALTPEEAAQAYDLGLPFYE